VHQISPKIYPLFKLQNNCINKAKWKTIFFIFEIYGNSFGHWLTAVINFAFFVALIRWLFFNNNYMGKNNRPPNFTFQL
jgi:hypothetical protein